MFVRLTILFFVSTIRNQNIATCLALIDGQGLTRFPLELNNRTFSDEFLRSKFSPHSHLNSTQQHSPIIRPAPLDQNFFLGKRISRVAPGNSLQRSYPNPKQFLKYSADPEFFDTSLIAVLLVGLQAATLGVYSQPLTCNCGSIKLWHGNLTDDQNSQHLTDWYTFSHVVNGFVFYGGLALLVPDVPIPQRFLMSVGASVGWEVFENSPFIINRYRHLAIAQGYRGDSIVNSISDTIATMLGFFLAHYLPVWTSVVLVIAEEVIVAAAIRDNLIINMIQLTSPVPAISDWQKDSMERHLTIGVAALGCKYCIQTTRNDLAKVILDSRVTDADSNDLKSLRIGHNLIFLSTLEKVKKGETVGT